MRRIHRTLLTLALAALVAVPALAATPAADQTSELAAVQVACGQIAPMAAAGDVTLPAADAALPAAEPLTQPAWGGICDPNRQCVTDADCGQFGSCAVYRLCVCYG
jgi:hypothetical protein